MAGQVGVEKDKYSKDVINETSAKIDTFLYELAKGTSSYKSLYNITEQVEHQYHRRFLVELLQNAHDALNEKHRDDATARIEMVIVVNDGPHGALYVANDGRPFSESNFKSLSQLGQSDKNPEESIGNKGIGFCSVLEITTSPEIYSRSLPDSPAFDGYCFSFDPSSVDRYRAPIIRLLNGEDKVPSPLDPAMTLVDWDVTTLRKFRSTLESKGEGWLAAEIKYLSPYLLPLPMAAAANNPTLQEFQRRGLVTVVKLPFKDHLSFESAQDKLEMMDATTMIFLERAKSLILDSGNTRRELRRLSSRETPSKMGRHEVTIYDNSEPAPRRYWIWKRPIKIPDASEKFKTAIAKLPGKWPELKEVNISIAVRVSESPEKGVFSIFLPTELPTGCAAHISAPFYGDMSRTNIDFKNDYNSLLLKLAAERAVDVIIDDLSGKDLNEARAIVDLIAPVSIDPKGKTTWFGEIRSICELRGIKLSEANIIFSDREWSSLDKAKMIPLIESPLVIDEAMFRKHASFSAIAEGLNCRKEALKNLYDAIQVMQFPKDAEKAATVEGIAAALHQRGDDVNWNGFWNDTVKLCGNNSVALQGRKILLGTDGSLHASGEECSVFLVPRQGVDEEDLLSEDTIRDVPPSLRPYVAFLHESIELFSVRETRRVKNALRKFLDNNALVQKFEVDDILRTVLVRRTPNLPIALDSSESLLCRDILLWGLQLVSSLRDRGKGVKTLRYLRSLPVPCMGGWYALKEASFGPGWSNTFGKDINDYLTGTDSADCKEAAKRLLQPPSNEHWHGAGESYSAMLSEAGVFDGLRLSRIEPATWGARFNALRDAFFIPEIPPPGFPENLWNDYRLYVSQNVKLSYGGYFSYEMQSIGIIPGLDKYDRLDEQTRALLMQLILGSMPRWDDSWSVMTIKKLDGLPDNPMLESPMAFALRSLPWICVKSDGAVIWSRPSERWYVTTDRLSGKPRLFSHLNPLSADIAQRLDGNPKLADALKKLGMAKFDTETPSASPRLLNDLSSALADDISDINVFLGQVRDAWSTFHPAENGTFPMKIVIRRGSPRPFAHVPTPDDPVYLPDVSASFIGALEMFSLPVVAIKSSDASRLAQGFKAAYGDGIQPASELKLIPLVDGGKWDEDKAVPFAESELEWIIPVVLSLVAFAGSQAKGTNSKPFRDRVEMFRKAKLCWVPSLEAGLFKGEAPIVKPPVAAIWLDRENILLATEECRALPHLLSEAISLLIERDDLQDPLTLVLKEINSSDPDEEEIVRAMSSRKIKEHEYREAREQWRGDLGQLIRLIRPIVLILDPDADIGSMMELNTEEAVLSFLNEQGYAGYDGKKILSLGRASWSSYRIGHSFCREYGAGAELNIWNEILKKRLGEQPLENENADIEFRAHIASVYQPLMSLLAAIIKRELEPGLFKELSEKISDLPCPDSYAQQYWEISFNHVMLELVALFEQLGATPQELEALKNARAPEKLRGCLETAGVDMGFNPLDVVSKNREKMENALLYLQKIGIAWCLEQKLDPAPWEGNYERFLDKLNTELETSGYTEKWDDDKVYELLQQMPHDENHAVFWHEVTAVTGFKFLLRAVGISDKDLNDAQERMDKFRENILRRRRLVTVCGKDFDSSEDNLPQLWSHIVTGISDDALSKLTAISVESHAPLGIVSSRSKRTLKDKEKASPKPKGQLSKSMEKMIGLAGEIHAYRMLKKVYGDSLVNQTTWVSGNSTFVFPGNEYDDGRGCDFVIPMGGKIYHIEVKASQGDDDVFKLGSSEIRLAMVLSKKKRSRKEIFQVLHVTNALSGQPSFRLLPNPYHPRYEKYFAVEETDARVRYKQDGSPGKER